MIDRTVIKAKLCNVLKFHSYASVVVAWRVFDVLRLGLEGLWYDRLIWGLMKRTRRGRREKGRGGLVYDVRFIGDGIWQGIVNLFILSFADLLIASADLKADSAYNNLWLQFEP